MIDIMFFKNPKSKGLIALIFAKKLTWKRKQKNRWW